MHSQHGVRTYALEDYIAWAEDLANLMGADWLDTHSAHPQRDPHVIATWLQQYQNTPPESISQSQQLLQIGELSSNIQTLRNAGTQNLETRIDDLRLDDRDRVASAIHEIRVAAEYVVSGRRAFFIPEAGIQTPDLLVDDCLEVECKHKTSVSPRDKARFELYGILTRKLRAVFPEHIPHSALILEVMFDIEPRRDLVDRIVATARSSLRRDEPSKFIETAEGLFNAHFEVLPAGSGPTKLTLPRGVTEFDQRTTEAILLDENGTLGRFVNLNAGCKLRQDRVKGIVRSVKAAARQFSGRFPAIVSVETSAIAARGEDEQLAHLREDVLAVLNSHTTISRVELSVTQFMGEPGSQIYTTSVEEIDNPNARFPISGG
jgi:septum formation topological specificity factor MinE